MKRPADWLCPWCDRDEHGAKHPDRDSQAVNFDLPLPLRVCHWCSNPVHEHPRLPTPYERACMERVASLRGGLVRLLADFERSGTGLSSEGQRRWRFRQHGSAVVGNAFLSALESLGCDRVAELDRAWARAEETHACVRITKKHTGERRLTSPTPTAGQVLRR